MNVSAKSTAQNFKEETTMKKYILIFTAMVATAPLIGCGSDEIYSSSKNEAANMIYTQPVSENGIDEDDFQVDEAYEFATEADAVEYYFRQIQSSSNESSDEFQIQSNGLSGIYVYSLENVPEDFSLGKINEIGNIEYYNNTYREADVKTDEICANNAIYFHQYRNANGADKLQNRIENWSHNGYSMKELSNKQGYYYVDCGLNYYVYWCEDGYCFYVKFPKSVGSVNTTTHEYSGEDVFTLQKTFYSFNDNTVAE